MIVPRLPGAPEAPRAGETNAARPVHWAFAVPERPPLPEVKSGAWIRTPVDRFILARLEREGWTPAPEADRATLLRRLSLDLTGLPPQPGDLDQFLQDSSPDAYEKLVDRWLNSPHYGEHWGRHWLDLARYADSDGYEKDNPRPYAYLYRDWVIEALNQDEPFDQFTIDQLAGDLLPGAGPRQKTATGFHRQTLINTEGGVDQEEFRCKAVVDRVNTTAAIWLGLTVACAECHNHKYDPISQREFFQLYAFFNNASERDLPQPTPEETEAYAQTRATWEQKRASLQTALLELGAETNSVAWTNLNAQLRKHRESAPKAPERKAAILQEEANGRETAIHMRGDFLRRGETVQPATLKVLHPLQTRNARPDRLDLARWLMDPANPLTARVTVNRIWRELFGRGLTATVDDFGTRGERPSHPELLDWLATEFPRLGWSQKRLIRLLVTSAVYRQESGVRPELQERDPANLLLARQQRFRLPAENVRDAVLAVSGLLNRAVGGPSVRPPLPADITALGYANSMRWKESQGAERYRRGLYIFFQRTVPYPMLTTFDAPDSNVTCTRRDRSNTPLQALTLLNDPVFFECAETLGRRWAAPPPVNPPQLIRQAFVACLARSPAPAEVERLERFYHDQERLAAASRSAADSPEATPPPPPPAQVAAIALARTLLNLDEFVTRE